MERLFTEDHCRADSWNHSIDTLQLPTTNDLNEERGVSRDFTLCKSARPKGVLAAYKANSRLAVVLANLTPLSTFLSPRLLIL